VDQAVEMTVPWKAWKTKPRFSTLPTAPWKSLSRFPHSHSSGDCSYLKNTKKDQNQNAFSWNQQLRVGQNKPPKWAENSCQTHLGFDRTYDDQKSVTPTYRQSGFLNASPSGVGYAYLIGHSVSPHLAFPGFLTRCGAAERPRIPM
jgi:hypothetical protein